MTLSSCGFGGSGSLWVSCSMQALEIFTFGSTYGWKKPIVLKDYFDSLSGQHLWPFYEHLQCSWYIPRRGVLFTCVYKTLLAEHKRSGGHRTFVSCGKCTALVVLNSIVGSVLECEGSFIWIYQKQMPEVMYVSERLGWDRTHQPGTGWGYQGISILKP